MRGNRLAIISRSGGHAVLAADTAEEFGFLLPPFPPEVIARVSEHSRAKVISFHNPLDLGDLFDLSLYRALADLTLAGRTSTVSSSFTTTTWVWMRVNPGV